MVAVGSSRLSAAACRTAAWKACSFVGSFRDATHIRGWRGILCPRRAVLVRRRRNNNNNLIKSLSECIEPSMRHPYRTQIRVSGTAVSRTGYFYYYYTRIVTQDLEPGQ